MGQIWVLIGRGCPPSTPRHFWVIFGKKNMFCQKYRTMSENSWNVRGPENRSFLRNHTNQEDAHRHNSNFGGRMTSPSSIWSPFVKKRVWAKSIDFTCNCCACTRVLCMHKILVHAQDSCACTRFLCMHEILVHAQDSCACTRFLCMHTNYM